MKITIHGMGAGFNVIVDQGEKDIPVAHAFSTLGEVEQFVRATLNYADPAGFDGCSGNQVSASNEQYQDRYDRQNALSLAVQTIGSDRDPEMVVRAAAMYNSYVTGADREKSCAQPGESLQDLDK